jgi:1-acyl-sn-glycerol-3-phosphate acyltransferase
MNDAYYLLCRWIARVILDLLFHHEAEGTRWLPRHGAFLLAANHQSFLDPPAFGGPVPRPIYFFARASLTDSPFYKRFIAPLNAIPVQRGGADVRAMKEVFRVLKAGNGLLVFPEGTRTPDGALQEPQGGVGVIAARTKIPVIPARISGSFEAWGKGQSWPRIGTPLRVAYGRPLQPSEYLDPDLPDREKPAEASRRIMNAIAALPDRVSYEII